MSELDTLTMEQVHEMDDATLRRLVAQLLGWTAISDSWWTVLGRPPGYEPSNEYDRGLPLSNWPNDLDAAATLVQGTIFHAFTLSGLYDFGWSATIRDHKDVKYIEHARQPARAVTLAWVAWKLAQDR